MDPERRRRFARTVLGLAGKTTVGVYIEQLQKWTDEHGARLVLTREKGAWTAAIELGEAKFQSADASLVVAFSDVARKIFRR